MKIGARRFVAQAIVLSGFVSSARAAPEPDETQRPVFQAATRNLKARDFMDTFGVNVHFGQNNYNNVQAIADALNIIGFSHVRATCTSAEEFAAWKELASKSAPYFPAKLKANVLIVGYLNAPDVSLESQQKLVPQIADIVESIEGPNEINNYFVGNGTHGPEDKTDQTTNFPANSKAWAQALFQWRQNTPVLAKAELLAPSIASGDPADYARLPDVSPFVDAGNIHFYAGNGRQPSGFGGGNFAAISRWYQAAAAPNKKFALTEWGQTTALKTGQGGCDETTQAKYFLNQMFDAAAMGAHRAYIYQLMDDTANGDPTGDAGTEAHFGIFDFQWRVKPAAQALANLKNLLADTSTNFTPRTPVYSVSGMEDAGAAGSSVSISKGDGSTFIVVWNEPRIWDSEAHAPIKPATNTVTVHLDGNYSYSIYDPLTGLDAIGAGQGTTASLDLSGSPILLHISKKQQ